MVQANENTRVSSSLFNSDAVILGESADNYQPGFRALYFNVKNIILREIEYVDREIEVGQFFEQQEAAPVPNPHLGQSGARKKKRTLRQS